nr:46 kDa FK506-binding nuclear protein isoform X2 [Aedes albopictus]
MFWGLVLKANKKYSQTVQKAFHLSQAALDLSKCGDGDVQVMLTSEDSTYLLCTLGKKTPQVALDLNFDEGDQISLSTKGEGVVHLTGYLVPSEEDFFGGDDDEELEEEEEVEDSPQKGKGKERIAKKVAQKVNAKEVQLEEDAEEDELDETFELPKGGASKKKAAGAEEEEEDSDDDDDEDDDEDDEDEDEDMEDSKLDGEADSDDDDEDDDDEDDDEDDDDEEDESEDEQPKAKVAKVEKKPSKQNGVENGKASPKELQKEGQKQQQQQEAKTRTLQGGLVVEDLKVGGGPEAKPGKKIAVYYEGRLKKNNKVFDSTNKGPGFKFALGRGEVIKGWDLGVSGMKVGGKRRLTVPHQLAYGTRGSPPVIPPNSTLVFDVELKNVF